MYDYISLLRGINVGGARKIAMADLRQTCAALGYEQVQTHLQSGNVRFRAADDGAAGAGHAAQLAAAIREAHGIDPDVRTFTAADFLALVAANPFLAQPGVDTAHLHLTVPLDPQMRIPDGLQPPTAGDEAVAYGDGCIYLYCPHGYGRTKLANPWWERALRTPVTTRNWRTTTALATMLSDA